jgi:hypothetical protein
MGSNTRRANKLLMDSFLKTIKPTLTSLLKGLHSNFKDWSSLSLWINTLETRLRHGQVAHPLDEPSTHFTSSIALLFTCMSRVQIMSESDSFRTKMWWFNSSKPTVKCSFLEHIWDSGHINCDCKYTWGSVYYLMWINPTAKLLMTIWPLG